MDTYGVHVIKSKDTLIPSPVHLVLQNISRFFFFLSFFLSKSRSFKFSAKISNLACLDENEVILQLHLSFQYNVSNSFTSSFIDI